MVAHPTLGAVMLAFFLILGVLVFFDILFWLLEKIPPDTKRLWPETDEELRAEQAYGPHWQTPTVTKYRPLAQQMRFVRRPLGVPRA